MKHKMYLSAFILAFTMLSYAQDKGTDVHENDICSNSCKEDFESCQQNGDTTCGLRYSVCIDQCSDK